jgi:hypothetical protein
VIARHVVAGGDDPARVADAIVEGLRAPDLRCAFVFADWRLDPHVIAPATARGLHPATVIGGTTIGVIGPQSAPQNTPAAVGLGLYGDWLRFGIGVATDLPKSALTRSRDAVHAAAAALGTTADRLDAARNVAITVLDGRCGHEEAFCIGSAAAAPRIRFVGGCVATEVQSARKPYAWANGEVLGDAGIVMVLQSELPCQAVTSSHLVPTELKTVVTASAGRRVLELDGHPAGPRLANIVAPIAPIDPRYPQYSFARYIDNIPYVRSLTHIDGDTIHLASAVEVGHVLHIMRPGDLIGQTRTDLAAAADRVGGSMAALLAFSCIGRHWDAPTADAELAAVYAEYPTAGLQTLGEQSGMLLVNHTLTGLAIGTPR